MSTTSLSVLALPGKPHSFSPKTPVGGKGTGPFTALSVSAVPGAIHSFAPKTPAVGGHTGLFTELSVIALPGGRHVFLPKEFVEPTAPAVVKRVARHVGGYIEPGLDFKRIIQDDTEILETIIQSFMAGIFD